MKFPKMENFLVNRVHCRFVAKLQKRQSNYEMLAFVIVILRYIIYRICSRQPYIRLRTIYNVCPTYYIFSMVKDIARVSIRLILYGFLVRRRAYGHFIYFLVTRCRWAEGVRELTSHMFRLANTIVSNSYYL